MREEEGKNGDKMWENPGYEADLMDGISYNIIQYIDHKLFLCDRMEPLSSLERHKSLAGVRDK